MALVLCQRGREMGVRGYLPLPLGLPRLHPTPPLYTCKGEEGLGLTFCGISDGTTSIVPEGKGKGGQGTDKNK